MTTLLQDARYAVRMLVKSPGFSLVAILTLALGIGANTAIFSVVNALLLRPLPYPEPDRVVMLWQNLQARGGPAQEWATPGNFVDWRDSRTLFAKTAAVQGWVPTLTGVAEPEPLRGEQVTQEYFDVLGVQPALGRIFRPDEDVPNAPRVVVLGHGLWTRRFGGDRSIIGRSITLGGEPHEVIGVMPDELPARRADASRIVAAAPIEHGEPVTGRGRPPRGRQARGRPDTGTVAQLSRSPVQTARAGQPRH